MPKDQSISAVAETIVSKSLAGIPLRPARQQNRSIRIAAVAMLATLSFAPLTDSHGQTQVTQISASPLRLASGDGKPKAVSISVQLSRGDSIHVWVEFRRNLNSAAGTFIGSYEISDNGNEDRDPAGGSIKTTLPRRFDDPGIYHVRLAESRTSVTIVHEPAPSWWSGFVDRLLGAAGGGTRAPQEKLITARLDVRPVDASIWTTPVPGPGHEIEDANLFPAVHSAMMPAWSPASNLLACSSWYQGAWVIAAYAYRPGAELPIKWRWPGTNSSGDFSPVWSPDGRHVAFVRRTPEKKTDIWLLFLDAQQRPRREVRLTSAGNIQQIVRWEPRLGILFETFRELGDSTVAREVWSMTWTSQHPERVGEIIARPQPYRNIRGWVPNRGSLIFAVADAVPPRSTIKEMAADGTDRILLLDRILPNGGSCIYTWPAVSPNGRILALDSDCPDP